MQRTHAVDPRTLVVGTRSSERGTRDALGVEVHGVLLGVVAALRKDAGDGLGLDIVAKAVRVLERLGVELGRRGSAVASHCCGVVVGGK